MNNQIIKTFGLFIIIIFHIQLVQGQIKHIQFDGFIYINESDSISYSMTLNLNKDKINGYSLTDYKGPNETKSEIAGSLINNHLELREIQVTNTSSESPLKDFCYVNISMNSFILNKPLVIEGNFKGKYSDGITCAEGKIKMIGKEFEVKKTQAEMHVKLKEISSNDTLKINWTSDSIKLNIWDANISDGDKIDLLINSKYLLKDKQTFSKRRKLVYPIKNKLNVIEITATNEGSSPPNTTRIELIDGNIRYPILCQLQLKKSCIIALNRR